SHTPVKALFSSLTTMKGAVIAAPMVVGVGLLFSIASSDNVVSSQKTSAAGQATSPAPAQAAEIKIAQATANTNQATPFSPTQRKEIGDIVREYLLANPQILVEVSEKLQAIQEKDRQAQQLKVLASSKDSIFRSELDFVLGDKDGDVTIVEYFDYNCGWCKRALNEVTRLTQADKKVRVVMKEFPIFGEHSEYAARAALASKPQGKYWEFHVALMKERRVTKDNVMTIAGKVGLDIDKLKVEMEKPKYRDAIRRNQEVATSLGIEGTPGFIIDSTINPGYLPLDRLKTLVADVRKEGCKFC
ncbi:MAG: DsbA family protein, partial [Hyphomicrobiaceae bacterium]